MKLLMVLLAVMSWTVTNKTSVSGDGEWPLDIEASYSCSYQKGDVRQGDQAVLTLTHLEGIAIEQVDVYLKSNQSGGAGVFTVAVDGQTVVTKSGTYEEWFGKYYTDYHALTLLSQTQNNVNTLVITLDGTANSLHIEKYVVTWTAQPARTVTLMKGLNAYAVMSEASGGQGIVLPALPDTAEWQFIGWSETEFYQISTMPGTLYPAQQRFYPKADCTLWAVYSYGNPAVDEPVTTLQSGVYLYVNTSKQYALAGVPDQNGIMWPATFDGTDENQYYQMDFTASLDTVYLTHVLTGTPIGYSGTKLTATKSPWRVYHQGEETVLYMTSGGKNYVLWLNVYNSGDVYTGLLQANPANSPLVLRLPSTTDEPLFTCHPESGMGFVDAKAGVQGTKTIRNGRLFIERDGQIFNVLGVRVR